ncbi:hypothetical protein CFP56_008487, partial [Quercus suber]
MAVYCATASSIKFPNSFLPRKQWLQLHTHQHRYNHYSSQLQFQLSGTGIGRSRTTHHNHKCFSQKQKQTESESTTQQEENEEFEFERLFSNLNQATLKREPGSLTSAIFLVAGTTVGAGILAIPAVTQESGFLASAVTCILCWAFMVVTGLLVAEVNVNTMRELGSGGVSLLVLHLYTLCPSCGLCGSFLRYFDKLSRHSIMGKCNYVFIDFWMHMLLRK